MNKKVIFVFVATCLFIACRDDVRFGLSDDAIAPLYSPPRSFPLNLEKGYTINPWTGDSIRPLEARNTEVVKTGRPIVVRGKSVTKERFLDPIQTELKVQEKIPIHTNIHPIPDKLRTRYVNFDSLPKIPLGQDQHGPALINILNDTISTGVPLKLSGKKVRVRFPLPQKAMPANQQDMAREDVKYMHIKHGMQATDVFVLLQDRNGYIWYGTYNNGLTMYDGANFMHFTTEHGLSSNRIRSLLEDKDGNIWMGYDQGSGITKYDGKTFTHYTEKGGFLGSHICSIIEDKKGNIWFASWQYGLAKYDGEYFTFYSSKEGLSSHSISLLYEDKKGILWIGTWGKGLIKFDGESFISITKKEGLADNRIRAIHEDREGNIWIGTARGGLARYDGEVVSSDKAKLTYFTTKEGLSHNVIRDIAEDTYGNLWIGTNGGGVNKYDGENFIQYTTENGLPGNQVFSIINTTDDQLWMACFLQGIGIIKINGFEQFTERDGIGGLGINAVSSDKEGSIWFGSEVGAQKYNGSYISQFSPENSFTGRKVRTFHNDNEGNLWIGTTHLGSYSKGGFSKLNGEEVTHYLNTASRIDDAVRTIIEDDDANLWLGYNGGGITKFVPASEKKPAQIIQFSTKVGLYNDKILNAKKDQNGSLWFATWGHGICKYEYGEEDSLGTFTYYTEKEGLPNNFIWAIDQDSSGRLWIGTNGGGICAFDGHEFTTYSTQQGLSSNIVKSITIDKNQRLWAATENGLNLFSNIHSGQHPRIEQFNQQDGLREILFHFNSGYVDELNRGWWGNSGGVTMLDLNHVNPSRNPPSLGLTHLEVNNEYVGFNQLDESGKINYAFENIIPFKNIPEAPSFLNDFNHLTFHFVAIDWNASHKIRYSYRIVGYDKEWSTPSPDGVADYRNLPPGHYTFQARAIGQSQEWTEPLSYSFDILPPWWWTWWAKTGYLLIGCLSVIGIVKWRTNELKRRQKELELKISKAIKDIEAEKIKAQASENAKQQFLANMSHEIRTPMNAIKGMTDILLRRDPKDQQLSYLNAIKESSNSLLVIINDILDISKIEAGKIDLEAIPFSINHVIENVRHIIQFKVEEKGLVLNKDIANDIPILVLGDPTRLHQILLNLTSNAIKFTDKGTVTIQLKVEKINENRTLAKFCISDTGVGIENDHLEKIFDSFEQAHSDTTRKFGGTGLGLSISKRLVELQKGKIWAESDIEKGSQFYFTIPFEIAHQTKEETASQDKIGHTTGSLKGVEILLVEDNQFNAIVAREELEDAIENVQVDVAENGAIALEKVQHNTYDVILMDVQMPVMNGYEATQKIRVLSNEKASIPIIAMTANVMKEEVQRCYEAGMDDFIGKPFDTEDLIAKIQNLLRKKT